MAAAEAPALSAAEIATQQAVRGRAAPAGGEQGTISSYVNARRKRDLPTDGQTVTLDRSLLVHGATTGDRTELKRRWPLTLDRARNRPGAENEIVVTPDKVSEYTTFLKTQIQDFAKMADERDPNDPGNLNRSALDAYLEMPGRRQSVKNLVNMLTTPITDDQDRVITRMADEEKIKQYLIDAPKGQLEQHWANTTLLMEEEEIMTQAAWGVDIISRTHKMNKPDRDRLGRDSTIILDNIVTPRRIGRAALSSAETAAVTAAWWMFARGNEQLKAEGDRDVMGQIWDYARLPANAAQLMYFRLKTGVDFARIDRDGRPQPGYNINTRALKSRISELHRASSGFIKQLGVDEHDSPFDISRSKRTRYAADYTSPYRRFPLGRDRYRPERGLTTRFSMSVSTETDRLVAQAAATGVDPFPGVVNAGLRERLFRLQAYENVAANNLMKDVRIETAGGDKERRRERVAALREKRTAMDSPDTFRTERREELNREIEENTNRRTPVEERRTALREGEGSLGAATAALQAKESEILSPEFGVVVVDTIDNAIETRINALTTQITAANTRLRQINSSILTAQKAAGKPLLDTLEKIATPAPPAVPPKNLPNFDASLASKDAQVAAGYKGQIDEQNDLIRQLTEQRAALRTKRTEYGVLTRGVEEATIRAFANNPDVMRDANASFDRITNPPVPFVPLATPDEVRTQTVDQLVATLNGAGLGADDAERRRMVFEAKAFEEANRTARLYPAQETAINYVMGTVAPPPPPLPEPRDRATILRMGVVELTDQIRAHYNTIGYLPPGFPGPPMTPNEWRAQVAGQQARDAFQGTQRIFRPLADARLTQEINYYDGNIRRLNTELEGLGNLQPLKDEMDAALLVIDDQESTFDRAAALVDNPQRMQELTSVAPINVNDPRLTPAEQAFTYLTMGGAEQPIPQGALNIYQELSRKIAPHQNRDRLMAALFRVLPPNELAIMIGEGLANTAVAPGAYDLGDAFAWADAERVLGNISEIRMQQTLKRIINFVQARAEAI